MKFLMNLIKIYCPNVQQQSFLHVCIGTYYTILHIILMALFGIVVLFSNNLLYLFIVFIIMFLDVLANIGCHDCLLTMTETKYLETSCKHERASKCLDAGIVYKCRHYYENQLDVISNASALAGIKICFILLFTWCNLLHKADHAVV